MGMIYVMGLIRASLGPTLRARSGAHVGGLLIDLCGFNMTSVKSRIGSHRGNLSYRPIYLKERPQLGNAM